MTGSPREVSRSPGGLIMTRSDARPWYTKPMPPWRMRLLSVDDKHVFHPGSCVPLSVRTKASLAAGHSSDPIVDSPEALSRRQDWGRDVLVDGILELVVEAPPLLPVQCHDGIIQELVNGSTPVHEAVETTWHSVARVPENRLIGVLAERQAEHDHVERTQIGDLVYELWDLDRPRCAFHSDLGPLLLHDLNHAIAHLAARRGEDLEG